MCLFSDSVVNGSHTKKSNLQTSEKISNPVQDQSSEQWKYASFGSNTLIGAYGNLSCATSTKTETVQQNSTTHDQYEKCEMSQNAAHSDQTLFSQTSSVSMECHSKAKQLHPAFPTKKVLASDIYTVIKKFLFIFKFKDDRQRFLFLCKFLLQNTEREVSTKVSQCWLWEPSDLVHWM